MAVVFPLKLIFIIYKTTCPGGIEQLPCTVNKYGIPFMVAYKPCTNPVNICSAVAGYYFTFYACLIAKGFKQPLIAIAYCCAPF